MKIYNQSTFDSWPLEDKSCQAIITSPPYWGMRKYDIPNISIGDWNGQYGLKKNYQEYIKHTCIWIKEAWRVLREDGIFFLNLGDTYSGSGKGFWNNKKHTHGKLGVSCENLPKIKFDCDNISKKCKLLIPHRIALLLIDDGWILRNDIIWKKQNPLPESVKDRFSKKTEYIFMFSKKKQYYSNLESVKVPLKQSSLERFKRAVSDKNKYTKKDLTRPREKNSKNVENKGCNPGDIWEFPTSQSKENHFASWPEQLVKRMILFSSRSGDKILDPFCGTGTTIKVAEQLGREGIGIDLGYQDIQKKVCRNV